jgi:hypothetical protein
MVLEIISFILSDVSSKLGVKVHKAWYLVSNNWVGFGNSGAWGLGGGQPFKKSPEQALIVQAHKIFKKKCGLVVKAVCYKLEGHGFKTQFGERIFFNLCIGCSDVSPNSPPPTNYYSTKQY